MIQIDIPMSKSCGACRFLLAAIGKPLFKQFMSECAVTGYFIGDDCDKTRHPSCPFLCDDCYYNKMPDDDFYCGYWEGKQDETN